MEDKIPVPLQGIQEPNLSSGEPNPYFCHKSPTPGHGHRYHIDGEGNHSDCLNCGKPHAEITREAVRLKLIEGRDPKVSKSKGGGRKMALPEGMIDVKNIATKAGVDTKTVRRILRKKFGGGEKKHYLFKADSTEVDKIVAACKATKEPKPKKAPKAKNNPKAAKKSKKA